MTTADRYRVRMVIRLGALESLCRPDVVRAATRMVCRALVRAFAAEGSRPRYLRDRLYGKILACPIPCERPIHGTCLQAGIARSTRLLAARLHPLRRR